MDDDVELVRAKRLEITNRFIQFAYEQLQASGERTFSLEIPARLIQSAKEHLETSGETTVMLLIETGEMVCIGISTRKPLRIKGPPLRPETEAPIGQQPWTFTSVTEDALLSLITMHGPIDVKGLSDVMGIDTKDANLRGKIGRLLYKMANNKVLQTTGNPRYRSFVAAAQKMHLRPQKRTTQRRSVMRGDVTRDRVIDQMRSAGSPIIARTLGDIFGIPRTDNSVRSKITEIIRSLIADGEVRFCGMQDGYRAYELVSDDESTVSASATS